MVVTPQIQAIINKNRASGGQDKPVVTYSNVNAYEPTQEQKQAALLMGINLQGNKTNNINPLDKYNELMNQQNNISSNVPITPITNPIINNENNTQDTIPHFSSDGKTVTIAGNTFGIDTPLPGEYQYFDRKSGGLVAGALNPEKFEGIRPVSSNSEKLIKQIMDISGSSRNDAQRLVSDWVNSNGITDNIYNALLNRNPSLNTILQKYAKGNIWKEFKTGVPIIVTNPDGTESQSSVLISYDTAKKLNNMTDKERFESLQKIGVYPTDYAWVETTDSKTGKITSGILSGKQQKLIQISKDYAGEEEGSIDVFKLAVSNDWDKVNGLGLGQGTENTINIIRELYKDGILSKTGEVNINLAIDKKIPFEKLGILGISEEQYNKTKSNVNAWNIISNLVSEDSVSSAFFPNGKNKGTISLPNLKIALDKGVTEEQLKSFGIGQDSIDAAKVYVEPVKTKIGLSASDFDLSKTIVLPNEKNKPSYPKDNWWTPWDESKGETFGGEIMERLNIPIKGYRAPTQINFDTKEEAQVYAKEHNTNAFYDMQTKKYAVLGGANFWQKAGQALDPRNIFFGSAATSPEGHSILEAAKQPETQLALLAVSGPTASVLRVPTLVTKGIGLTVKIGGISTALTGIGATIAGGIQGPIDIDTKSYENIISKESALTKLSSYLTSSVSGDTTQYNLSQENYNKLVKDTGSESEALALLASVGFSPTIDKGIWDKLSDSAKKNYTPTEYSSLQYESGLIGAYGRGSKSLSEVFSKVAESGPTIFGWHPTSLVAGMGSYLAPHSMVSDLYSSKGLVSTVVLIPHFGPTAGYTALTWQQQNNLGRGLGIGAALLPFATGPAGSLLGKVGEGIIKVPVIGTIAKGTSWVVSSPFKAINIMTGGYAGLALKSMEYWAPWKLAYEGGKVIPGYGKFAYNKGWLGPQIPYKDMVLKYTSESAGLGKETETTIKSKKLQENIKREAEATPAYNKAVEEYNIWLEKQVADGKLIKVGNSFMTPENWTQTKADLRAMPKDVRKIVFMKLRTPVSGSPDVFSPPQIPKNAVENIQERWNTRKSDIEMRKSYEEARALQSIEEEKGNKGHVDIDNNTGLYTYIDDGVNTANTSNPYKKMIKVPGANGTYRWEVAPQRINAPTISINEILSRIVTRAVKIAPVAALAVPILAIPTNAVISASLPSIVLPASISSVVNNVVKNSSIDNVSNLDIKIIDNMLDNNQISQTQHDNIVNQIKNIANKDITVTKYNTEKQDIIKNQLTDTQIQNYNQIINQVVVNVQQHVQQQQQQDIQQDVDIKQDVQAPTKININNVIPYNETINITDKAPATKIIPPIVPIVPNVPNIGLSGGGGGYSKHGLHSTYTYTPFEIPEMYVALPGVESLKPDTISTKMFGRLVRQPKEISVLGEENFEDTPFGRKAVRTVVGKISMKSGAKSSGDSYSPSIKKSGNSYKVEKVKAPSSLGGMGL